jgi:hypothetical protein
MCKLLIGTLAACLTLCAQIVTPPVTAGGSGSGTVTSIVAGTGLSGGTITASGTIACLGATASQIGCSKPDNSTIKATAGVYAAQSITIDSVTCTPGGSCTAGVTQLTGDVTAGPGSGSQAATVVALNGTSLAGLATGLLTNTTSTGVPTITALPLAIANGGTGAATMAAYGVLNNATGSSAAPTVTANPVVTTITSHGSAATDSASLGTELTTSGSCSGTGWTGTFPNYVAPGTTAALTCTGFTSGSYYQTVTSIGAGGSGAVTVSIGGTQTAAAASGTLTAGLKANGTSLTFTPASTYTGTIGISAKLITPISVFAFTATDSTGAASTVSTQTLASLHNYFFGSGGTYNTTGANNAGGPGYENLYSNTTGANNAADLDTRICTATPQALITQADLDTRICTATPQAPTMERDLGLRISIATRQAATMELGLDTRISIATRQATTMQPVLGTGTYTTAGLPELLALIISRRVITQGGMLAPERLR